MPGASQNPDYPDAHPTAPGGMSFKALVDELVKVHGHAREVVETQTWPVLIGRVSAERRNREQEQESGAGDPVTGGWPEEVLDDLLADRDDDLKTLLAEMEEAADVRRTVVAEQAAEEAAIQPLFLGMPGVQDYIFDGHAGAGPSASERWMSCTMSLQASREFLETLSPRQQQQFARSNTAARQGTTAHSAAEVEANLILGNVTAAEVEATLLELSILPDDEDEAYSEEMGEYITEYLDLVISYAQERGDDHILVEQRVQAAIPLTNGEVYVIPGSADLVGLPTEDDPVLVVGDLKYGNGIWVDVDGNSQARIYALGVLDLLTDDDGVLITDVETIRLHIIQPRLGGIRTFEESLDDLLDWRDDVLSPALSKALAGADGGAEYAPSDGACQFCPARGGCPALTTQRIDAAQELFDVMTDAEFADGPGSFPETTSLTDEQLGSYLRQVLGLTDLASGLKEEAQRRLYRGQKVPGFKLVSYTPPRKWQEGAQEQIVNETGLGLTGPEADALFKPPALITPKQALAALGDSASKIAELIEIPDKRPVMAPEGDRRKDWTGAPPEQMFEIESGSDA